MRLTTQFIILSKGKGKKDRCSISLRLTYNRKRKFIETGLRVYQDQFNQKAASTGAYDVIKAHPEKHSYNEILRAQLGKVQSTYESLLKSGQSFTVATIKDALKGHGKTAIEVFVDILSEDRSIEKNTKAAISTMIVRLGQYRPDVLINEVDYQFAKDFEKWLRLQPTRVGGVLSINSTNKYLRDLKRMLGRSIKYGYVEYNKLSSYDFIKEPRGSYEKRDHLTLEDIERLEAYEFPEKGAKLASILYTVDAFLFSCYTGLRISDIMKVCANDYEKGVLTITMVKGGGTIYLPLDDLFHGKGKEIFNKYSRRRIGTAPLFGDRSKITHQGNIRIIKRLLFPERKISFHSARHSFTTNLLEKGVNAFIVQKLLGHKKIETTVGVYDHHSNEKDFEEVRKKFG